MKCAHADIDISVVYQISHRYMGSRLCEIVYTKKSYIFKRDIMITIIIMIMINIIIIEIDVLKQTRVAV